MKKRRALILTMVVVILAGAFVKANTTSLFLDNGFAALYYHAVRLEEAFPE